MQQVQLPCAGCDSNLNHKSSSSKPTGERERGPPQEACCYVLNVHDLMGGFSAVPGDEREKLQWEFFLDPSQWWDHRSEKVTEHQMSI